VRLELGPLLKRICQTGLLWIVVNRQAPASLSDLLSVVPCEPAEAEAEAEAEAALAALEQDGRIGVRKVDDSCVYDGERCVIPLGATSLLSELSPLIHEELTLEGCLSPP
jgi:hypothetical protein